MKKIDLTKEYPHLDATYTDYPVSSDVYAVFEQSRLDEQAQAKRLYLYYFSGMTLEKIAHMECQLSLYKIKLIFQLAYHTIHVIQFCHMNHFFFSNLENDVFR